MKIVLLKIKNLYPNVFRCIIFNAFLDPNYFISFNRNTFLSLCTLSFRLISHIETELLARCLVSIKIYISPLTYLLNVIFTHLERSMGHANLSNALSWQEFVIFQSSRYISFESGWERSCWRLSITLLYCGDWLKQSLWSTYNHTDFKSRFIYIQ